MVKNRAVPIGETRIGRHGRKKRRLLKGERNATPTAVRHGVQDSVTGCGQVEICEEGRAADSGESIAEKDSYNDG